MSELWTPNAVPLLKYRARKKTVTLPNGERALITFDDSGTVQHTEHGEHLDAIVRPKTVKIQMIRRMR